MIDYQTPRYKTSEVARAASLGASALRNYFARKRFTAVGLDLRAPDGDGLPTLFSLRDALTVAAAAGLIRAGAEPEAAFHEALRWAHTGTPDRLPAQTFAQGRTVLIYNRQGGTSQIVRADDALRISDLFFHPAAQAVSGSIVLCLNDVESTVFAALKI